MYLQKVGSKKTMKKPFFRILSATDEKSKIRIRICYVTDPQHRMTAVYYFISCQSFVLVVGTCMYE